MALFSGVLYDASKPPSDPHFQLDVSALESIAAQLKDVPIRIEHTTADDNAGLKSLRDVGRVTRSWFDNGVLGIDWKLDDTAAGWSSERLIETGVAPELSLQHALSSDGTVRPVEVSLVRTGARDGCSIMASSYKPGEPAQVNKPKFIMASAADTQALAPASDAPAADKAPESAPPAAAQAAAGGEPAAKRAKYESPMDFVNDLQSKITDANTLQTILDYFGETMETSVKAQNEVSTLREAKALLEKSQQAHVDSSKNVVRDIVDALSAMYQNFGSATMEQPHKDKLSSLLVENVDAREALRPILVAASAISNMRAVAAAASSNAAVTAAAQKISVLSEQLMAAKRLGGLLALGARRRRRDGQHRHPAVDPGGHARGGCGGQRPRGAGA